MPSYPPPKRNAVQVRPGANNTWLIKCRHGHEKTNHGMAFALYLWAVSHGTTTPEWGTP